MIAVLAHKSFLTGVLFFMYLQPPPLFETLPAFLTNKRFIHGVREFMIFQGFFLGKASFTGTTFMRLLARMFPHMPVAIRLIFETLKACGTSKRPLIGMRSHMVS